MLSGQRRRTSAFILLIAISVARPVSAEHSVAPKEREDGRIDQLETELNQIKQRLAMDDAGVLSGAEIEQASWLSLDSLHSTKRTPISFGDRYPTFNWSGFLQLDGGEVVQDELNIATVGNIDAQLGLRRVRLRAFGDVRDNAHYVVDLDFAASGHPSFRDVYFGFRDVPYLQNASLGYFKTPFSMDGETSGQELLLLERQPPFAFVPFRQTGVRFNGTAAEESVTWATAVYAFPTDRFGVGTGDGFAGSARVTALPFVDESEGRLVHVGIGYGIGSPADGVVRYSIEPGFFVTDPDDVSGGSVPVFVDTGDIPARWFQLLNFEFAGAIGPFRWQAESRFSFVDQRGGPGLAFSGSYVQLGLILTGERPQYDRRRAVFHRVVPEDEFRFGTLRGAWELSAGWSVIDLNDRNISGGRMYVTTLGINWYMTEYTRFMFNIDPVVLDDPDFGRSRALVIGSRFQVSF